MANDNNSVIQYPAWLDFAVAGVIPHPAWVAIAKAGANPLRADSVDKKDGVKPSSAYLSLVREQSQKKGGAVKE